MQQIQVRLLHKNYKEAKLYHRYITNDFIEPLLKKLPDSFDVSSIGDSVKGLPIFQVRFGVGPKRVLLWSQMHGNESTTTKALFDVFNVLSSDNEFVKTVLRACTFVVIPILNPDGAKVYTRANANSVDLNRDAQKLSQPESIVLRNLFDTFKPDICFNLHGQRTIFSAGAFNEPATMSFLSPSCDKERTVTRTRKKAMELIVAINTYLQKMLPNQIGRYDDGYNSNCVGDTFQSLKVPTVLFEAGHYKNDYAREHTREYVFHALVLAFNYLSSVKLGVDTYRSYFDIPENKKLFYDLIIRNALIGESICDIAIQYQETLIETRIEFLPKVEKIADLSAFYGHSEFNAKKQPVFTTENATIYEGYENDFVMINNELLSIKI